MTPEEIIDRTPRLKRMCGATKGAIKRAMLKYHSEMVASKNFVQADVSGSFANLCRECGKTIAKPREYCDEHYPYKIVSK